MKKISLLLCLVLSSALHCMYHPISNGRKLKYNNVKVSNKTAIPMRLEWVEISNGRPQEIVKNIAPGEVATVEIGKLGGYSREKPAKVVYHPIRGNNMFKQEFRVDLPNAPAFGFTAVNWADILNNIWVPGVIKADDDGNPASFQYQNLDHFKLEQAIQAAGAVKPIK